MKLQYSLIFLMCRMFTAFSLVVHFLWESSLSLNGKSLSLSSLDSVQLLKEVDSLTNLEVKTTEVVQVILDLLNGKVNQHTSDLRSDIFSNELLNIWIDEFTYQLFVVRVLRIYSWDVAETFHVVGVDLGVRAGQESGT